MPTNSGVLGSWEYWDPTNFGALGSWEYGPYELTFSLGGVWTVRANMVWEPENSRPYELILILELCMDRTVQYKPLTKPSGGWWVGAAAATAAAASQQLLGPGWPRGHSAQGQNIPRGETPHFDYNLLIQDILTSQHAMCVLSTRISKDDLHITPS